MKCFLLPISNRIHNLARHIHNYALVGKREPPVLGAGVVE